jgi:chemotaxis methyl-accepting protein methylase
VVTALRPKPDKILVFACSDGCESYSIAMAYQRSDPATKPRIQGYDIEDRCVEHARRGVYERSQLDYYRNGQPAVAANQRFFEKVEGGACQVKTEIAALCEFNKGSILDAQFMAGLGRADVVFCQNVLVHLSDEDKIAALENLLKVTRPDGLLAIAGMQPDARERITLQLGLRPVTERCQEIHDGWLDLRELWDKSRPWQRPYYALEPFRKCRKWEYRYSTLFLPPTSA